MKYGCKAFYIEKGDHIGEIKKVKTVFQISYSTTLFEDTGFQANSKNKANADKSSEKKDIGYKHRDNLEKESDDESSNQGFKSS